MLRKRKAPTAVPDLTPKTINLGAKLLELQQENSARMRSWSNYRELLDGVPGVFDPSLREPSELDLEMLQDVGYWLEHTAVFSQVELWKGVQRAHEALYNLGGKDAGRRYIVTALKRFVTLWISAAANDRHGKPVKKAATEARRAALLDEVMSDLRRANRAFADLSAESVRSALDDAASVELAEKRSGGAANIRTFGLAARLSVRCKAFGDDNVARSTRAFRDACDPKKQVRKRRKR